MRHVKHSAPQRKQQQPVIVFRLRASAGNANTFNGKNRDVYAVTFFAPRLFHRRRPIFSLCVCVSVHDRHVYRVQEIVNVTDMHIHSRKSTLYFRSRDTH